MVNVLPFGGAFVLQREPAQPVSLGIARGGASAAFAPLLLRAVLLNIVALVLVTGRHGMAPEQRESEAA